MCSRLVNLSVLFEIKLNSFHQTGSNSVQPAEPNKKPLQVSFFGVMDKIWQNDRESLKWFFYLAPSIEQNPNLL